MSLTTITRAEIKSRILDWQKGALTARQIREWANKVCVPGDNIYDDEEGDESIACEVLFLLDVLDMNLSTVEDAPLYLRLLETPKGGFEAAMKDFDKKFAARDLKARKHRLQGDPLYSAYTK
jgi:hypothetical protein